MSLGLTLLLFVVGLVIYLSIGSLLAGLLDFNHDDTLIDIFDYVFWVVTWPVALIVFLIITPVIYFTDRFGTYLRKKVKGDK